jgi:hypothetical protein
MLAQEPNDLPANAKAQLGDPLDVAPRSNRGCHVPDDGGLVLRDFRHHRVAVDERPRELVGRTDQIGRHPVRTRHADPRIGEPRSGTGVRIVPGGLAVQVDRRVGDEQHLTVRTHDVFAQQVPPADREVLALVDEDGVEPALEAGLEHRRVLRTVFTGQVPRSGSATTMPA